MTDRAQCSSATTIDAGDGRTRRVRCERTAFKPLRYCNGPHRAETGPPIIGPDNVARSQVASWT